jgi:hypothetical protein
MDCGKRIKRLLFSKPAPPIEQVLLLLLAPIHEELQNLRREIQSLKMASGLTRGQIRSEARGYLLNTDSAQAGWTDAEINSYIDEGCFYIQQLTNSFQDIAIAESIASQADYSLPDNCYQIIRTAFDRQFLPQTTEYELDRDTSSAWRGDPTGTPCRFYLKQHNMASLYQIPRTSGPAYTASQETGELVQIDSTFSFSSEFGVVTQLYKYHRGQRESVSAGPAQSFQ